MFKRNLLTVLVATAAVGLGGFAINASAATGAGTATAVIQTPLTATQSVQMNFGTIAPDGGGGTVALDTADGVTAPANFVLGGGAASGEFSVTAQVGLLFDTTLPASTTLTGPGPAMTVNNFSASIPLVGHSHAVTTETFTVGADLVVNASQPAGTYNGIYSVLLNYQ
jgi:hypothetical protein